MENTVFTKPTRELYANYIRKEWDMKGRVFLKSFETGNQRYFK